MDTLILDEKVDRIAVVKAGQAQFGNASSVRPKVECVIQLAGVTRNLPVSMVPQQTIRVSKKRTTRTCSSERRGLSRWGAVMPRSPPGSTFGNMSRADDMRAGATTSFVSLTSSV